MILVRLHFRDDNLIWRRVKKGGGFSFINQDRNAVSGKDRQRLLELGIPPAWNEVVVSSDPLAHIQAIGKDARGRKQYIYHPELVKHNQKAKFNQMVHFGEALPSLRQAVRSHMMDRALTRDRVIATIVWLLEHTFIRIGNKVYAEENQSYGLTTMRDKHVEITGDKITFSFMGKSGIYHELGVSHPRVAKTIKACNDLPGYEIFKYLDQDQQRQVIDAEDINNYLQIYAGADFSAKDFRTWGGSVLAGQSFYEKGDHKSPTELKKNTIEVITEVSQHLGNTKTVCRTYYIHPTILKAYEQKSLIPHFKESYKVSSPRKPALNQEEYAMWSLIKA